MAILIGEFHCKIDDKGRLSIPARLRAQLPNAENSLIINRGFEKCLVLFTLDDWQKETEKLQLVDDFLSPDIRKFKRLFTNGATSISIDSAQRILIPKPLLQYAGITTDLVLTAQGSKVEIWDKTTYERELQVDADELSKLAQTFHNHQKK